MLLQNQIDDPLTPILNNRSNDFCYKEVNPYFNDIMSIRREKINDNFNR
jgi:hypothetical protein